MTMAREIKVGKFYFYKDAGGIEFPIWVLCHAKDSSYILESSGEKFWIDDAFLHLVPIDRLDEVRKEFAQLPPFLPPRS